MRFKYLFLCFVLLFCLSSTCCFAEGEVVVGKISTDKMVYEVGEIVTVIYSIENHGNKVCIPVLNGPCLFDFNYEVFSITSLSAVADGKLTYTGAQYVWEHNSEVFAIGALQLKHPGFYRIIVYAPDFEMKDISNEGMDASSTITPSAATAIRVIKKTKNNLIGLSF